MTPKITAKIRIAIPISKISSNIGDPLFLFLKSLYSLNNNILNIILKQYTDADI